MIFLKNLINLQNFNFSIIKREKSTYLIVYNKNFYSIIKIQKGVKILNNLYLELIDVEARVIRSINEFLKQFYLCNFTKIKFTGKGYKIKKNSKQSIVLLFNRSHTTTLWWRGIFLKKLKKYKMYIKYNKQDKMVINTILNIRPINIFTKKGLREARQIFLKKKGKK